MNHNFENRARAQGFTLIAGLDEAGRGPLAGPVVAAACILPENFHILDLNDSKKLSAKTRQTLYQYITNHPSIHYAIASCSPQEIDTHNILRASLLAMKRAALKLPHAPDYLLIDGNQKPPIDIPLETIVKGDSRSPSIAAASILAKEYRDTLMQNLNEEYPEYNFAKHKGYPTKEHMEALEKYGPTPHHRQSFAPVKKFGHKKTQLI